jgi:hypothetical protein
MNKSIDQLIAERNLQKDVGYYNIEIIKDNKEISTPGLSLGLASLPSSPCSDAVAQEDLVVLISERGQKEKEEDLSSIETLPDEIKTDEIKRAIVQYWHNPTDKIQHKLKVTMNCDFGNGEETIEWIAAMTKDLGNYKKYHPECSRDAMIDWAMTNRKIISESGSKPYMGKFHESRRWNQKSANFNQTEPYTSALLFWHEGQKTWNVMLRLYDWSICQVLSKDNISAKQKNLKAQTLWLNPTHYPPIQRPLTWAQKNRGRK